MVDVDDISSGTMSICQWEGYHEIKELLTGQVEGNVFDDDGCIASSYLRRSNEIKTSSSGGGTGASSGVVGVDMLRN